MARNPLMLGGLLAMALVTACQPAAEAPAAGPQPVPAGAPQPVVVTPQPGGGAIATFTSAQADRGGMVFNETCSACHSASDFTNVSFRRAWADRPVHDLFSQVQSTMPMDAPGSLTAQQYADVLAYMMRLNGVPVGSGELGTDEASLTSVRIGWTGN